MKKIIALLITGGLVSLLGINVGVAQEEDQMDPAAPVELFACSYAEGKGPKDLDYPLNNVVCLTAVVSGDAANDDSHRHADDNTYQSNG